VKRSILVGEQTALLRESRARVVASADEARRQLQRDVHDGAQQRLVHAVIALKLARDAVEPGSAAAGLVREALAHAEGASRALRDVLHAVLPESLTRRGLEAGLRSLVRDLAIPVDVRIAVPRLPVAVETTAYFVVAEALSNVVEHAAAEHADLRVELDGGTLVAEVRDGGRGGADPARGSGLTGLLDRVEAADGRLTVTSPAGGGTTVRAELPVRPGTTRP
jgi:signal transduction histidine kinase